MGKKPEKPNKKLFAKNKPLDEAVVLSKNTPADTKALENAKKELDTATKKLEVAMNKSYEAQRKAHIAFPDVSKTPATPPGVPIPYPNFAKVEKETKGAVKGTQKALKDHEKAQKKVVKVIDKELKTLKSSLSKSKGDEVGTVKGLISAKNVGKTQWAMYGMNVKAEGKNVGRFLDIAVNHTDKPKK